MTWKLHCLGRILAALLYIIPGFRFVVGTLRVTYGPKTKRRYGRRLGPLAYNCTGCSGVSRVSTMMFLGLPWIAHCSGAVRQLSNQNCSMTEIKCDFDGDMPRDFAKRLGMVVRFQRLRVVHVRIDRTRHGWHVVVVVLNRVAFPRLVMLQAILGSDWKRELFNSRRALAWRRVPAFWRTRANVLYERHYKGVTP